MLELMLIASFIIIFTIQLLLCFKVKSRIIRMLPMIVLVFSGVVLFFEAQKIPAGWDRLGYAIFMIYDVYSIVICGIAWMIWAIMNCRKNREI